MLFAKYISLNTFGAALRKYLCNVNEFYMPHIFNIINQHEKVFN